MIKVNEVFKGDLPDQIVTRTRITNKSPYLFFAKGKYLDDGFYIDQSGPCSYATASKPVSNARFEIFQLRLTRKIPLKYVGVIAAATSASIVYLVVRSRKR